MSGRIPAQEIVEHLEPSIILDKIVDGGLKYPLLVWITYDDDSLRKYARKIDGFYRYRNLDALLQAWNISDGLTADIFKGDRKMIINGLLFVFPSESVLEGYYTDYYKLLKERI